MQVEKTKIVFLDFCGTCVPFQSADKFVFFVAANYATLAVRFRSVLLKILMYLRLVKRIERWSKYRITSKKLILSQLKGLNESVMEEAAKQYFIQIIKPSLIPEIYDEIKKKQKEGFRIVVVSGGYDIYIKYFMEYIGGNMSDVLATPLIFVNEKFTGKMGLDCMAEAKITYIQKYFNKKDIYSVAYSDSLSDTPLFNFADEAHIIAQLPDSLKKKKIMTMYYYE